MLLHFQDCTTAIPKFHQFWSFFVFKIGFCDSKTKLGHAFSSSQPKENFAYATRTGNHHLIIQEGNSEIHTPAIEIIEHFFERKTSTQRNVDEWRNKWEHAMSLHTKKQSWGVSADPLWQREEPKLGVEMKHQPPGSQNEKPGKLSMSQELQLAARKMWHV